MARDKHHLPVSDFERRLSERFDGRWELLATAANLPEAVEITCARLSRSELSRGAHGLSGGQSLIRRRVEALAVSNKKLLVELARGWPSPLAFPGEGDGFVIPAWRQSLRHVAGLLPLEWKIETIPALADEIDMVFSTPKKKVSWDTLLAKFELANPIQRAFYVRLWSASEITDHVVEFKNGRFYPMMLRVLRGRLHLLNPGAVSQIVDYCLGQISLVGDIRMPDLYETAIAAEACRVVAPNSLVRMRTLVSEMIEKIAEPLSLVPLVYVLLETEWQMP